MSDVVTAPISPALRKVLDGAVDLHCHSGPSPFPRRFNHVEAARDAERIGMRAILVKSHHHNTVMDLLSMRSQLDGLPVAVYGGVALNSEVGGVNPSAVAMSLRMGGRCVWGPTVSARQHIHAHNSDDGFPSAGMDLLEKEETIFDETGSVSEDAVKITQLVAEAGALLTGGHLGSEEMKAYLKTARDNGVKRMLIHHPDFIVDVTDSDLEEMLGYGAYVEHELAMYHPDVEAPAWPIERLVDWIDRIGPERTVIDSDLGQRGNPLPVDGYVRIIGQLLDHGVSETAIRRMICQNTAFLLGLEEAPS